jgi:hypothetical protein
MKIIIPTNDNITIAPDFENAKSFRMITIINGRINEESVITVTPALEDKYPFGVKEFGNVTYPDTQNVNNEDKMSQRIALTLNISSQAEHNLIKLNYVVFHSVEENIINGLNYFLKNQAVMESDYCCCP